MTVATEVRTLFQIWYTDRRGIERGGVYSESERELELIADRLNVRAGRMKYDVRIKG